jgi:hypothetical protein
MLTTIQFDNKFGLRGTEIGDEVSDGMLPAPAWSVSASKSGSTFVSFSFTPPLAF